MVVTTLVSFEASGAEKRMESSCYTDELINTCPGGTPQLFSAVLFAAWKGEDEIICLVDFVVRNISLID